MEKAKAPELRFQKDDNGQSFPDWEKKKFSMLYKKSTEKNDGSIGIDKNITVATMQFKPDIGVSKKDYLKTYNTFNVGDIAFEGHHSKEFKFGRFVENDIGNGIVSHIFSVFRPIAPYDLQFWKYAIHSEKVMQRTLSRTTKASTMMHDLVTKDFLKESILVPSLREQKKIGDFLLTLDRRISLSDKKLGTLQNIKKGMLQKIFSQELRFKDDDGNEFPAWEADRLVTKCRQINVGFVGTCDKYYVDSDSGVLMIRTGNLGDKLNIRSDNVKYISYEFHDRNQKSQLQQGDILIARHGNQGHGVLYTLPEPANALNIVIVRTDNTQLLNTFLIYALDSQYIKRQIFDASAGSTQVVINTREIERLKLLLPSLPEQQKIAAYFTTLDRSIAAAQKKAAALRTIKKGLLQKMFI
ncbi:MAG: restriction endonuclease subunit S [Veillonellaceae bacterium]|nr:restriction endonuclease subunit S [Veillonellaceae bacterium]